MKSSRRRKQRQSDGNGYNQLEGEWLTYYKVSSQYTTGIGFTYADIKSKSSVRGGCKIPKKGGIKFPTSYGNMVSYGGKTIIGGPKEDDNIGRIS